MKNLVFLFLFVFCSYNSFSQLNDIAVTHFICAVGKQTNKDYKGAIDEYTKAIQYFHNYYYAYFYRGIAKIKTNDKTGAMNDLNAAIQMNPNYLEAYINRAILFNNAGNNIAALNDLNMAISLDSKNNFAYYYRAMVKKNLMDNKNACNDMKQALLLGNAEAKGQIDKYCKQKMFEIAINKRFLQRKINKKKVKIKKHTDETS